MIGDARLVISRWKRGLAAYDNQRNFETTSRAGNSQSKREQGQFQRNLLPRMPEPQQRPCPVHLSLGYSRHSPLMRRWRRLASVAGSQMPMPRVQGQKEGPEQYRAVSRSKEHPRGYGPCQPHPTLLVSFDSSPQADILTFEDGFSDLE